MSKFHARPSGSRRLPTATLLASVALSALGAIPAGAQDPQATGDTLKLEPISVESSTAGPGDPLPPAYAGGQVSRGGRVGVLGNQDIMDVPFSVTGYTEETIRNQQADTIADVLANDPSVRSGYGYGNFSEQFVIRGFPLYGEDIAIDGLYGNAPRQIVGLELYERVEVLKGANTFLNGVAPAGTGIGGSVNLVPKRAGDEPLTRITGSYAMNSQFGTHLDSGRRFGPDNAYGVRVNAVARDGETAIEDEERQTLIGAVALDYRGERARVTLDAGHQRLRIDQGRPVVFLGGGIEVPEAPAPTHNYATDWSYSELKDSFGQVRGEFDVTDSVMAYAQFGARFMREDGDYASPTVTDASTGAATVSRLTVPREDLNLSGQAGLRTEFATGPVGHSLNVGVSGLTQENRNAYEFGSSSATNIYDTPDVDRPATLFAGGDFDSLPLVSRTELTSLFASDTVELFDDRLRVTAGLRAQQLTIKGFDRSSGAETSSYDESAVTPVVGAVVKVTDQVSLYANRIEGLAQGPEAPATAVNSGEIFPPYRSKQYEVGAKADFGRFGAGVALFQTTQPSGTTDPDTLVFGVDGEQRNRGLEVTLFGEPHPGVRLLGGVTLLNAELTETAGGTNDGNNAPGVSDYQVNLGAEWDLPYLAGVTLSGRVLHTGPQFLDAANTQEVDSWTRLDIGARYVTEMYGTPVTFNAFVENVTDESYWASASGGYLTQGDPLTGKLSVSARF
ncbi:TonB-dependent siderophore receptor [Thalassobaculum sp.]|uniref:TonB-dependent receptor n=1 Tax=Thalassobaculum sp. TaxID=2022740 RepID=UPI0032EF78CB